MLQIVIVRICLSITVSMSMPLWFAPAYAQLSEPTEGSISGMIWIDNDGNEELDNNEYIVNDILVYIDSNNNETLDEGEPSVRTNNGYYQFSDLPRGVYTVRQVVPFGQRNTALMAGASFFPFTAGARQGSGKGLQGSEVEWRQVDADDVPKVVPSLSSRPSRPSPVADAKIIGGDYVSEREYPFMVAVGFEDGSQFNQFCGGSLIADRWVVTAAHCTPSSNATGLEGYRVVVGADDIGDGDGVAVKVKETYIHPLYLTPNFGFDVGLWELETPVRLRRGMIETVDMLTPSSSFLASSGTLATTVGWGTSDRQEDPARLQDVHVPVSDASSCYTNYNALSPLDVFENFETQICAGVPEGGIDACQGDSGGPLVVRDQLRGQWKLAGITSWGFGCASAGLPGVYARVSELSDWVKAIAVEPSSTAVVMVGGPRPSQWHPTVIFGNQTTTGQARKAIPPRWQAVSLSGKPETGAPYDLNLRIIDESIFPRTYSCTVDVDGDGPITPLSSLCQKGMNVFTLDPVSTPDILFGSITIEGPEANFIRQPAFVMDDLPETTVTGTLSTESLIDPDFFESYYAQYYRLTDISYTKGIQVRVYSSEFSPYVTLYNLNQRYEQGFGGAIEFNTDPGNETSLVFKPEPGTEYLLGISTLIPQAVGSYQLTVVNEGGLEPYTAGDPLLIAEPESSEKVMPAPPVLLRRGGLRPRTLRR